MTQTIAIRESMKRNYLKKGHSGILVSKKAIKSMRLSIIFSSSMFFIVLIVGGWIPCFDLDNREVTRAIGVGSLILIFTLELRDLYFAKKLKGVFEGNFENFTGALKALKVYLNHSTKENGSYEIQVEPITSFKKQLLIVKDCGTFCKITGEKHYMEYMSRHLVDLKLK